MKSTFATAGAALALFAATTASGQTAEEIRTQVNDNTVYVIGGSLTGTNSALVWDLAKTFDGTDLRVLPINGRGSLKTTEDILYLAGIDAGTVQADVLDYFVELDVFPNIKNSLRYISSLHDEEVHIVVRRDSGNEDISDLAGKKVNFGPASSGTFLTSSVVFDRANVTVEALSDPYDFGLQKLRNGEIDAVVRVAGAPTSFLRDIPWEESLKILPIRGISGPYKPTQVTSDHYPGLIADGEAVDTVAIPSVLIAYNHPEGTRRDRVNKFAATFYEQIDDLKSDGANHPKWQEVDTDANVSGWVRWGNTTPDS